MMYDEPVRPSGSCRRKGRAAGTVEAQESFQGDSPEGEKPALLFEYNGAWTKCECM